MSCEVLESDSQPDSEQLSADVILASCLQAFIDKFRYNAKRASMVQSRIKALERLEELEAVEQDPEYVFKCAWRPYGLSWGWGLDEGQGQGQGSIQGYG